MARKKSTGQKRTPKKALTNSAGNVSARKRTKKRKRPAPLSIRRSSGRKEKFDLNRMARTTGRSGVPFMMARDIAKNVSKKIKAEAKGKRKEKIVTAGRVRSMIARELQDRNHQTIASSYTGEMPENVQKRDMNVKVDQHGSFIGSADRDQHEAYRANKNSVLHDRSKRARA
jgi:hypothetical protein